MASKDKRVDKQSFRLCVFLPVCVSLRVGIYTVCVLLVWEWSMLGQLSRELSALCSPHDADAPLLESALRGGCSL